MRDRLLKSGLFVVAWLVGLELLTRFFLVSPSNVISDPVIGTIYAPNSSALIETTDAGFRRADFNELGLNDWPVRSDDHRPRILVLGDSYVEALQVPRPENFVGILGRDRPQLRFINGGRSGLDPISEYLMLQKLAPLIHPSVVVLVVNAGDAGDMQADGLRLSRCGETSAVCDYIMPSLYHPDRTGILRFTNERSGLLTYLTRRFVDPIRTVLPHWSGSFPGLSRDHPAPHVAGTYQASDFEPILALVFGRIARRYRLIVVAIPDIDFRPDGKSVPGDGGKFERLIRRAAGDAGAAFFDAGPDLIAAYAKTGQPPRGFEFNRPGLGHLNAAGHVILAHGLEKQPDISDRKTTG